MSLRVNKREILNGGNSYKFFFSIELSSRGATGLFGLIPSDPVASALSRTLVIQLAQAHPFTVFFFLQDPGFRGLHVLVVDRRVLLSETLVGGDEFEDDDRVISRFRAKRTS